MFNWLNDGARQVMDLADQESERLSHNYIGNEHILVGIARQVDGPAARALLIRGLDAAALRVELDRLVDRGILPPPWRRDSELLKSLGIDIAMVRHSMEQTFGVDAVDNAIERTTRRTGWTPLCAKALWVKQSFYLAGKYRDERGQPSVGPVELLLGVLADARDPIDKPRCFRNPWARRKQAHLGLPQQGPTPVRLIIEARGWPLRRLHNEVLDDLQPSITGNSRAG